MALETCILDGDRTQVVATTPSSAKALASNLIRQDKWFSVEPYLEDCWRFIVQEDNERKDYMGRA